VRSAWQQGHVAWAEKYGRYLLDRSTDAMALAQAAIGFAEVGRGDLGSGLVECAGQAARRHPDLPLRISSLLACAEATARLQGPAGARPYIEEADRQVAAAATAPDWVYLYGRVARAWKQAGDIDRAVHLLFRAIPATFRGGKVAGTKP